MYSQPLNYFSEFELRKFQGNIPVVRGRSNHWVRLTAGGKVLNFYLLLIFRFFLKSKESFSNELIINPGNISGSNGHNYRNFFNDSSDQISQVKPKKQKKISYFQKMYRFVYEYLDNSSIHGFGHLTARKRHLAE